MVTGACCSCCCGGTLSSGAPEDEDVEAGVGDVKGRIVGGSSSSSELSEASALLRAVDGLGAELCVQSTTVVVVVDIAVVVGDDDIVVTPLSSQH